MANLSKAAKAKQKLSREKKCGHCSKPLESQAFWTYFTKLRGNTVWCVYCTEENYVAKPDGTGKTLLVGTLFFFIGLIISFGIVIAITASTYNEYDGTVRIIWWLWAGGFFLTAAITRFLFRAWQWKTGYISVDKIDKDYGEI